MLLERTGETGETEILLLRRAVEPGIGGWDLPAGYLDPGESFEMAARRETAEEAGLDVELVGLAGVYHSPAANAVSAVYRARASDASGSGQARLRIERARLGATVAGTRMAAADRVRVHGGRGGRLGERGERPGLTVPHPSATLGVSPAR